MTTSPDGVEEEFIRSSSAMVKSTAASLSPLVVMSSWADGSLHRWPLTYHTYSPGRAHRLIELSITAGSKSLPWTDIVAWSNLFWESSFEFESESESKSVSLEPENSYLRWPELVANTDPVGWNAADEITSNEVKNTVVKKPILISCEQL